MEASKSFLKFKLFLTSFPLLFKLFFNNRFPRNYWVNSNRKFSIEIFFGFVRAFEWSFNKIPDNARKLFFKNLLCRFIKENWEIKNHVWVLSWIFKFVMFFHHFLFPFSCLTWKIEMKIVECHFSFQIDWAWDVLIRVG
jgi:hypothetical protein